MNVLTSQDIVGTGVTVAGLLQGKLCRLLDVLCITVGVSNIIIDRKLRYQPLYLFCKWNSIDNIS